MCKLLFNYKSLFSKSFALPIKRFFLYWSLPLCITLTTVTVPLISSVSVAFAAVNPSASPSSLLHSSATMAWLSHGRDNNELIDSLVKNRLLLSPVIARAMKSIDRYHFILPSAVSSRAIAYQDSPQPIGYGATISAPHMHAMCLELVKDHLVEGASVLDVGSGSGYLTAVISVLVGETGKIIGIEHMKELVEFSQDNMKHYPELSKRVKLVHGDGRLGYPSEAPYDIIHVGAAAAEIPINLKQQLRVPNADKKSVGGVLVIPVGDEFADQQLRLITRTGEETYHDRVITGVRYVPLTDSEYQRNQR